MLKQFLSKNKFSANIFQNGIGEAGSRIPLMGIEILAANVFGPTIYGLWASIQLVLSYNNFSHFGIVSAYARIEPKLLEQSQRVRARIVRNVSFTISLSLSLVTIAILIPSLALSSFWIEHSSSVLFAVSVGFLFFAQNFYVFIQTSLQNRLNFKELSFSKLVYSISFFFFFLIGHYSLGIVGATIAWALSYFLGISVIMWGRSNFSLGLLYRSQTAKRLFRLGLPIFSSSIARLCLATFDKWSVVTMLGKEALGIYSASFAFLLLGTTFSGIVSRVYSPYVMRESANSLHATSRVNILLEIARHCSILVSVANGALLVLLSPTIKLLLPAYTEGIFPGYLLIITGHLIGVNQFLVSIFVALELQNKLLKISAFFTGSAILSVILVSKLLSPTMTLIALLSCLVWLFFNISLIAHIVKTNSEAKTHSRDLFAQIRGIFSYLIYFFYMAFVPILLQATLDTSFLFEDFLALIIGIFWYIGVVVLLLKYSPSFKFALAFFLGRHDNIMAR